MSAKPDTANDHLHRALSRQAQLMKALGEFSALSLSDVLDRDQDPYQIELAPCACCHGQPHLQAVARRTTRWTVTCSGCNKTLLEPQKTEAKAIITWNILNPDTQDYRDLPFFGLSELDPEAAKARMNELQRFLELQAKLVGTERAIAHATGQRPPKMAYQHRLEFLLKWAILAQALIKKDQALTSSHAPWSEAA